MSRKRNSAAVAVAEKKRRLTAPIDDLLFRRVGAYAKMHGKTVGEIVQPALEAYLRGCFWVERTTTSGGPSADLAGPSAGDAQENPPVEAVPVGETLNPFQGDMGEPDAGAGEGGGPDGPTTSSAKRRRSAA